MSERIRLHHVENVLRQALGDWPDMERQKARAYALLNTQQAFIGALLNQETFGDDHHSYREDVYGSTPEEYKACAARQGDVLSTYYSVRSQDCLRISPLPDDLCAACEIGDHCKDKNGPSGEYISIVMLADWLRLVNHFGQYGISPQEVQECKWLGRKFIESYLFFEKMAGRARIITSRERIKIEEGTLPVVEIELPAIDVLGLYRNDRITDRNGYRGADCPNEFRNLPKFLKKRTPEFRPLYCAFWHDVGGKFVPPGIDYDFLGEFCACL